jgi:apolipoprotein D and lipocalin family protein
MCPLSLSAISTPPFKHYPKGLGVFTLGIISLLQGCSLSIPAGVKPVTGFDVNQYLGHWYEIARLDNRFQRGLEQVTATYSLRRDGSICVENAGWNVQKKQQKKVMGKAKFVSAKQIGHLKVSFWGPFYSSYVIFHLESDYSVAVVCGSSKDYCWILAKNPTLSAEDLTRYRKIAEENGFAVERFIYTSGTDPASIVDY